MKRVGWVFLFLGSFTFAKQPTLFLFFLVDDREMMDLGTYGSTFHAPPTLTTYLPQRKNK
jgi:hypothetical protein